MTDVRTDVVVQLRDISLELAAVDLAFFPRASVAIKLAQVAIQEAQMEIIRDRREAKKAK